MFIFLKFDTELMEIVSIFCHLSVYCKFPKYSDTPKICSNHSKILTMRLYNRVMSPNDADGMANSADPDQTAPDQRSSLIWVCTVCPGISVQKLRKITLFAQLSQ